MRVAPSNPGPVDPKILPSHSLHPQGTSSFTSRWALHKQSSALTLGDVVECAPRELFALWFRISCATCSIGLTSAIFQLDDDNLEVVAAAMAVSTVCLISSVSSLCFYVRVSADFLERFFISQVLILNMMFMFLPLTITDPWTRAMNLTWHSVGFKLLALPGRSLSRSIVQLACSCLIDAAAHLAGVFVFEGNVGVGDIVFIVLVSGYIGVMCFVSCERLSRCSKLRVGQQETMEKILTEAFDSWAFLDQRKSIWRCLGDIKGRRADDPVCQLLAACLGSSDIKTRDVRQAFRAVDSATGSNVEQVRAKVFAEGGDEQADLLVLRPAADGLREPAVCCFGRGRERVAQARVPCYVVGLRLQRRSRTAVEASPRTNPSPGDAGHNGQEHARPSRPADAAMNSMMQSEDDDSQSGRSEDASIVSKAARSQKKLSGLENQSSSIFDVPPPVERELDGPASGKSFQELVGLGRREHWIVDPQQLCLLEDHMLGSGTFGTVLQGTYYGAPVAIKMPKSDKKEHLPLLNELRTLRRLRHPNIVLFLGAHVVPSTNDMALVFELIEGQTLHDWIKTQTHPVECDAGKLNILRGISLALRYLHQQDKTLVHGDLKGSNVFVENGTVLPKAKLGDFGLARFLYKTEHTMGGSLRWMAPEIATGLNRAPSCAADIFSLGALFSFTLTDVKPFDGVDRAHILKTMRKGQLPRLTWPAEGNELSRHVEGIGDLCYCLTPTDRPDIMQVLDVLDVCMKMTDTCPPELM